MCAPAVLPQYVQAGDNALPKMLCKNGGAEDLRATRPVPIKTSNHITDQETIVIAYAYTWHGPGTKYIYANRGLGSPTRSAKGGAQGHPAPWRHSYKHLDMHQMFVRMRVHMSGYVGLSLLPCISQALRANAQCHGCSSCQHVLTSERQALQA